MKEQRLYTTQLNSVTIPTFGQSLIRNRDLGCHFLRICIGNSMISSDTSFGINTSDTWDNLKILREAFMPNITYKSYAIICLHYDLRNSLSIFLELLRSVGEQIGFNVLVCGPAGPDIEPGRRTFLSTLVF